MGVCHFVKQLFSYAYSRPPSIPHHKYSPKRAKKTCRPLVESKVIALMKTKPLTTARRSGPLLGETATVTAVGAEGRKSSQTQPIQSGILLCIKPQANQHLKHLVLMRHPTSQRKRSTQRFALLMSHLGSKKWRTGMFHWLTS